MGIIGSLFTRTVHPSSAHNRFFGTVTLHIPLVSFSPVRLNRKKGPSLGLKQKPETVELLAMSILYDTPFQVPASKKRMELISG